MHGWRRRLYKYITVIVIVGVVTARWMPSGDEAIREEREEEAENQERGDERS